MTFAEAARRGCDGLSLSAKWIEGFVDSLLPGRGRQRMRGALISLLFAGLFGAFIAWALQTTGSVDFAVYYFAAASFLGGDSPYGVNLGEHRGLVAQLLGGSRFTAAPYFYPPLTAALVSPLTLLPFIPAAWIWNAANAVAVVAGTALLLGEKRWRPEGLLVWGAVALFRPNFSMLHVGQISGLMYFCIAYAIYTHDRNRPIRAGAAIACGALLKVTPVVLIGYFVWRSDWRAVIGAAVGTAAIVLATLPIVGIEGWIEYFTIGIGTMHSPDSVAVPTNLTLNGMFLRMLSEGAWTVPLVVAPGLAGPLWIASALAVVVLTIAACWPPLRKSGSVGLEVAFILVALQLIAPFSFYYHLTLSLLPALVLILAAWRAGSLGSCWFIGLLLLVVTIDAFDLTWVRSHWALQSVPTLAIIALWAALGTLVVRERRASRGLAGSAGAGRF